jgi:phage FluMu gp28-like protein
MNGMLTIDDLQRAPAVLLPYQQQWVADTAEVKIVEKSRRIGITWAESSDDVLVAATEGRDGEDVLYVGYNQEMTREYIQTCAPGPPTCVVGRAGWSSMRLRSTRTLPGS